MTDHDQVYKYNCVMLVDDSELDNFVNKKILEACFFAEKIYANTSAVTALESLKNIGLVVRIPTNILPEVIFIDLSMPIMDGFEFIRHLISLLGHNISNFKLVVLTSSLNANDERAIKQISKEIVFLRKPLTPEKLLGL